MRTLFISLLSFVTLGVSAQAKMICVQPSCTQTVNVGDTAFVYAWLTAPDGFGNFIWTQKSGPSVTIAAKLATVTAAQNGGSPGTQSGFGLRPTTAGTYVFSVTGVSYSGTTAITTDTLIVNAKPVAPAPRTVVSLTITINGQVTAIPVTGAKFTYSDGSTQ